MQSTCPSALCLFTSLQSCHFLSEPECRVAGSRYQDIVVEEQRLACELAVLLSLDSFVHKSTTNLGEALESVLRLTFNGRRVMRKLDNQCHSSAACVEET